MSHLFLIHTLFRDTWDGITGAFWSMGLEAQFYVAFPFLAWAWNRIGVRAIAYAALASLVFRTGVGLLPNEGSAISPFLLSITFLGRWMQFAAGMAGALWVRHTLDTREGITPAQWTGLTAASALLGLTGLVAPSISQGPVPLRDILLATGSAGLLASLCTAPKRLKSPLLRGPLPFLGRISYSLYLIHFPVCHLLVSAGWKFFSHSPTLTQAMFILIGSLVASLLAAHAMYQLVEFPSARWAARMKNTKQSGHPS